jgi:hypothetical protein
MEREKVMIYLFIGTVIGIAICSAFCGIILYVGGLQDVPQNPHDFYLELATKQHRGRL